MMDCSAVGVSEDFWLVSGKVLFRKVMRHLAEFIVTTVYKLLGRHDLENRIVALQHFIHQSGSGVMVSVRTVLGLWNDFVNDLHFLEIRRRDAQSLRGNFFLGGIAPHDGCTAFR